MPLAAWSSSITDCCQDINTCCYGFWCCPCLACTVSDEFGENRCLPLCDILGPGVMASFGIPICVPPAVLSVRVAMRHKYGIKGSLCKDIAVACFCECCAWCQMQRELLHQKKKAAASNKKKKAATANVQSSPAVQMQPVQVVQPPVMMMPAQPVPPGYVVQPGMVMQPY